MADIETVFQASRMCDLAKKLGDHTVYPQTGDTWRVIYHKMWLALMAAYLEGKKTVTLAEWDHLRNELYAEESGRAKAA